MTTETNLTFAQLGLAASLLKAVEAVGYEAPTPIQEAAIPPLLAGRDVLGQAQTGTGKTAAFALPLLNRLDLSRREPQLLVLTPTRELAIQVAEAMQTYARYLEGFHILPVYGGQSLEPQLRQLKRGVHAVVGTPGRLVDHLRRGSLVLDGITAVVLDEADEMLRMGFQEEVEAILDKTPVEKQVALFSATLPAGIRKIARQSLKNPAEIRIKSKTTTVAAVRQCYWRVLGASKLEALTRILEVEDFDAMLIFVRTKTATVELTEKLEARGFACSPLNGDMSQPLRERAVDRLRSGALDILVATDVAARGLDVDRITHVINFDIPYDAEAYVHRIGRTGRAGREGKAILFVSPRERNMLFAIERATRQPIEKITLPTPEAVTDRRIGQFKQALLEAVEAQDLSFFEKLVRQVHEESGTELEKLAGALAFLVQKDRPLLPQSTKAGTKAGTKEWAKPSARVEPRTPSARPRSAELRPSEKPRPEKPRPEKPHIEKKPAEKGYSEASRETSRERPAKAFGEKRLGPAPPRPPAARRGEAALGPRSTKDRPGPRPATPAMDYAQERYRVEVGSAHGVQVKNIVGAIANEAGLENRHIGRIEIFDTYSTLDLPEGMPREVFRHLKTVRIFGQALRIHRLDEGGTKAPGPSRPPRPEGPSPRPGAKGPRGKPGTAKPKGKVKPKGKPKSASKTKSASKAKSKGKPKPKS